MTVTDHFQPGLFSALAADPVVPELQSAGRGTWTVEVVPTSTVRVADGEIVTTTIELGSRPRTAALIAAYPIPDGLADRLVDLEAAGKRVTVLLAGENFLGGSVVSIIQGRLTSGGDFLLPSGSRRKGFNLSGGRSTVLDVIEGTGSAAPDELNERFHAASQHLRDLDPFDVKMLARATEAIPVAVLATHPGFGGGPVPGCVWVIDHFDAENGIADGYLWTPESELVSEHGSAYLDDLSRWEGGAKELPGPVDVFELPTDRAGAYQAFLGR